MSKADPTVYVNKSWLVWDGFEMSNPFFKQRDAEDHAKALVVGNPVLRVIIYEAVAVVRASISTHEKRLYEWFPPHPDEPETLAEITDPD